MRAVGNNNPLAKYPFVFFAASKAPESTHSEDSNEYVFNVFYVLSSSSVDPLDV
jgi:hypothetical protein